MRKFLLFFIVLVSISIWVFAEVTIHFKNGRNISGNLININKDEIAIAIASKSGIVQIKILKEEIDNINGFSFDEFYKANVIFDTKIYEEGKAQEQSFQEAIRLVEEKRKLKFLFEIKKEILNKNTFDEYFRKKVEKELKEEDIIKGEKLLVRLGLLDKGIEYKTFILDLFSKSIYAFYDFNENKIYFIKEIISSINPFIPNEVFLHELVHALQDQYIYLDRLEDNFKGLPSDTRVAIKSVIEGEATFVSYSIISDYIKKISKKYNNRLESLDLENFILEFMLLATKKISAANDRHLIAYLIFPYIRGALFIKYAFDNGGWELVDKLYKDLPLSTEQIFHPEKYFFIKDQPIYLEEKNFDFLTKEGFKKILSDRLGELTFYIILSKYLDDTLAKTIAAGWGNDYCYLYESKEQKAILIMDTIWDSTSDAEEFFKGIKALCDKKYSQLNWQTNKDFFIGE
ncbi:MAG: hypothetical protein NC935_02505, partial [Candidatus Omnitrophica bacterium]|nr:hypothetical protein [Candidatus Omnitrophota bacterium]